MAVKIIFVPSFPFSFIPMGNPPFCSSIVTLYSTTFCGFFSHRLRCVTYKKLNNYKRGDTTIEGIGVLSTQNERKTVEEGWKIISRFTYKSSSK